MTPTITEEYLIASGKKIEDNQAPKPDGVPNEALKAAIHKRTHLFMKTMKNVLKKEYSMITGSYSNWYSCQREMSHQKIHHPTGQYVWWIQTFNE